MMLQNEVVAAFVHSFPGHSSTSLHPPRHPELPYTIDTIRHGYETLTGSNAKYSRHRVTMLVSPMDAKLVACFVL